MERTITIVKRKKKEGGEFNSLVCKAPPSGDELLFSSASVSTYWGGSLGNKLMLNT